MDGYEAALRGLWSEFSANVHEAQKEEPETKS
jgi:hypothetical protein